MANEGLKPTLSQLLPLEKIPNELEGIRDAILNRDKYKCTKCGIERPKYLGINRKLGVLEYEEYSRHGNFFLMKRIIVPI